MIEPDDADIFSAGDRDAAEGQVSICISSFPNRGSGSGDRDAKMAKQLGRVSNGGD